MGPRWDVHLDWWLGCPWRRVGKGASAEVGAVRLWCMSNFWRRKGGKEGSYIGKVLRLQWSSKTISARPVVSPWSRVTCQRSPRRWALVNRHPCCWTSISHRDHSACVHHASCVVTMTPCIWLVVVSAWWFSASSITDVFWWWLTYDARNLHTLHAPCHQSRLCIRSLISDLPALFLSGFQLDGQPVATSGVLRIPINGLTLGQFFPTKSSAPACCSIHWKNVPSPCERICCYVDTAHLHFVLRYWVLAHL